MCRALFGIKFKFSARREVRGVEELTCSGPNRHLICTMLRRRRSLPGGDEGQVNLNQSGLVKRSKEDAERVTKERMAKLKMVRFVDLV